VNQCVKKCGAVAVTEDQALMASDSGASGFGERSKTEIGQAATFESSGPLHKSLGFGVNPKAQAGGAGAAFGGGCKVCGLRHWIAPRCGTNSLYVQWENNANLILA
jgi:hypothetical protein